MNEPKEAVAASVILAELKDALRVLQSSEKGDVDLAHFKESLLRIVEKRSSGTYSQIF
jgi:hypothetical protein